MQVTGKIFGHATSFDVKVESITRIGVLFWINSGKDQELSKKTEIRLALNKEDLKRLVLQVGD
jgi:hypothetical protein